MTLPFPGIAPAKQDPTTLLALTILGEAENQPYAGKVAVGKTLVTRSRRSGKTIADTALANGQYDCWSPQYAPQRVAFLQATIDHAAQNVLAGVWEECVQAAEAAMDPATPDPSNGATHYCTILDANGDPLWDCDDENRARPRWHSHQCIVAGITHETARLGAHVFAITP